MSLVLTALFFAPCLQRNLRVTDLGVGDGSLGCVMSLRGLDTDLGFFALGLCLTFSCPCNFVYAGKIHTPMEYKGELASYDMRLR